MRPSVCFSAHAHPILGIHLLPCCAAGPAEPVTESFEFTHSGRSLISTADLDLAQSAGTVGVLQEDPVSAQKVYSPNTSASSDPAIPVMPAWPDKLVAVYIL